MKRMIGNGKTFSMTLKLDCSGGENIMTHCWLCGASEIKSPNSKYTYYGRILGKRVQKTIRICNCCSAMRSDEDIREEVAEIFGWDYNEED